MKAPTCIEDTCRSIGLLTKSYRARDERLLYKLWAMEAPKSLQTIKVAVTAAYQG